MNGFVDMIVFVNVCISRSVCNFLCFLWTRGPRVYICVLVTAVCDRAKMLGYRAEFLLNVFSFYLIMYIFLPSPSIVMLHSLYRHLAVYFKVSYIISKASFAWLKYLFSVFSSWHSCVLI